MKLVTDPVRRALMQRIRRRGTPAERIVAQVCRDLGLRYRLNVKSLPGSPDLANKARRWAVFVHGCFWHQHPGCGKATVPKRNNKFWRDKFASNKERDERKTRQLRKLGYKVAVVWQCKTENRQTLRMTLARRLSEQRPTRGAR